MKNILPCIGLAVLTLVSGCQSSDGDRAVPAHGVLMTALENHTSAGGRVVEVHLVNHGAGSAFLVRCGGGPRLTMQTFRNGIWQDPPPIGILCVQGPPGPVEILGQDSLIVPITFSEAGRYRFKVGVASNSDLGDMQPATSNPFTIP